MKKTFLWTVVSLLTITFLMSFLLGSCAPAEPAVEELAVEEPAVEEPAVEEPAVEEPAVEEPAPEKFTIGVLAANFDDKWMSYMHQGIEEKGAEVADVAEVIMVDGKNEHDTQIQQAEDFIARGVDAIVCIPIVTMEDNPILDLCLDAGIPLITVNRMLQRQELATVYVGSDSLIAGELQMGYLAEISGGEGNIVILMGEPFHEAAINRTQGFENIMEGYPDLVEVARDTGNWRREEGQTLMENWLQAGMEFDIVASNNDEMAIGAVLAMQGQGVDPDDYFIGGVDATPDALEYLNDGLIDCTVFQDAYGQGRGGLEAAIDILEGKDVPDIVWIPYELVTPDDYETYKARWE